MGAMTSQITSLTIVYSTVYSGADQRKHESFASLAFVGGIHRWRWIPAQMSSNAENVSIWWRHHDLKSFRVEHKGWFNRIFNVVTAENMAAHGAKASTTIIVAMSTRNIPGSALDS